MIIDIHKKPIINAFYGTLNKKINVMDIIIDASENNKQIIVNNNTFKKYLYNTTNNLLYLTLKNNNKFEINDNSILNFKDNHIEIKDNKLLNSKMNIQKNKFKVINPISNPVNNKINKVKKINYNYILSTNVRDEKNILEFILYHLMIGFDKIFIIDHLSKEKVEDKINILPINLKQKIEVVRFEKEGSHKLYFLNNIILPYMKKYCKKYFIHLDGDEYINLNNNFKNVDELLLHFNYPEILTLNWVLFGSNNKDKNDNEFNCLIPTFTKSEINLCNHFKILININFLEDDFYFINPHQIYCKDNKIKYTNINNNHFYLQQNIYKLFTDSDPNISFKKAKAYINHYTVQSKEEYYFRKINRNRDDINTNRSLNINVFNKYNNVVNDNLIEYYDRIEEILKVNDIGFILLRCVNSEQTNKLWINCYNSIRSFYDDKIMIIDDHSKTEYLSNINLVNCFVIDSEFKGRGELLPYYYYLKYNFCKRVMVLHDSMIIKKKINFDYIYNYNNFTRIYSFDNNCYNIDITYFKLFCDNILNGDIVYNYHLKNIRKLLGCFGVCYIIDYKFLKIINDKYNIINLVKIIDSRDKRKTLERFLSCLFELENDTTKLPHLLGSIFDNIKKQKLNEEVFIYKNFYGR